VQTSTQLENKSLFPTCEETGGLFCSSRCFRDLQKTHPWFPVAFSLRLPSDIHQLPFFPSHPSSLLSRVLRFGADRLDTGWRSVGPICSSQQAAVASTRTFFGGPHVLGGSRAVALLCVTQVRCKGGRKMEHAQGGEILEGFSC